MKLSAPHLHTIALIVAAGNSERFGGDVAKPYIHLGNQPLIRRAIETFITHPRIDGVRVVINRKHHMLYKKATRDLCLFPPVFGAERRQDSVRLGLESIAHRAPKYVLIHDAARPFIDHSTIDRVLDGLKESRAVLPCVPVQDTIREDNRLIDRSKLTAAQTPQGFHHADILAAHQQYIASDVTDDIALAEMLGIEIKLVHGDARNMKLTTPDQLKVFEAMLPNQNQTTTHTEAYETRSGMGFDVHAFIDFAEDKPSHFRTVALCGLRIPHERKLKGHSDADVGLHALVDAMLGAIGEGDIGLHFPPDDPKWAGADSSRFLLHAFELLKQKHGEIVNIDMTIMCEAPKITPHRTAMCQQIANLLKLDVKRVNIKATTTEKLGFLGRSEGIAAQAIINIKLPLDAV